MFHRQTNHANRLRIVQKFFGLVAAAPAEVVSVDQTLVPLVREYEWMKNHFTTATPNE